MSSSGDQTQLRKSLERAQRAADRLGVSNRRARRGAATVSQFRQQFGVNVVTVAISVAAIWGVTALLGVPINLTGVAVLGGLGILVSLATNRTGSFGFGFWIFTTGVVLAALKVFVPASVASQFGFITNPVTSIPVVSELLTLGPVALIGLAFGVVTLAWLFDIRIGTSLYRESGQAEAVNPDTVASALADRYSTLFEDYVDVSVAFAVLGVTMLSVAAAGGLEVFGEVFAIIGQDPVGVVAVANTFVAWLGLGGSADFLDGVPVISDGLDVLAGLTPELYAVFGIIALGLAFAAREAQD